MRTFLVGYGIILKHLNQHAPYKTKRVKTSKMPNWYNEEIAQARRKRDDFKRRKLWADFKTYRNKTKQLIKIAKHKHFSDSVTDSKDTRAIWQHFRKINNKDKSSNSNLPEKVIIDDIRYAKSEDCCKTKWIFFIHFRYISQQWSIES